MEQDSYSRQVLRKQREKELEDKILGKLIEFEDHFGKSVLGYVANVAVWADPKDPRGDLEAIVQVNGKRYTMTLALFTSNLKVL